MKLYVQLNFGGNCKEAFQFYAQHLGGRITMLVEQRQMPNPPPGAGDAIIHAPMEIADTVLIGNDVPRDHFQKMRSAYLYLSVDSTAEAQRIHALLSEGGEIFMPLEETFFAIRFSMIRDRFGVNWAIIHERAG